MHPTPTRGAALRHLADFAPRMGMAYATGRNTDPGPGTRPAVSGLSPFIRHRLLTEAETIGTALSHHGPQAAEKFIQEVFWRSYWKGWLELRPAIWAEYRQRVAQAHAGLATSPEQGAAYAAAAKGATGIACFDAWMRELRDTGTLHNHTRMWVASIWIFTLRLPWVLGADLFLHRLVDGDAASNTLSWRWVAGSQTKGKHYLARAENIARHTNGRFDPRGELNEAATPIVEPDICGPRPLPVSSPVPSGPVALLLHEDDLHAESLDLRQVVAVAGIARPGARSPMDCAPVVEAFAQGAVADGVARAAAHFGVAGTMLTTTTLDAWIAAQPAVVTPHAPVGWVADALAGLPVHSLRREWDSACWPLATKGFFAFREQIPALVARLKPMPPAVS